MKIGLVLSGGFARGAAQEGFLKGLLEGVKREEIDMISASSIGALNAFGLSTNNMGYLERLYQTSDYLNLRKLKLSLKNHLVDSIVDEMLSLNNKIEIPFYLTGTCMNNLSTHYFYFDSNSDFDELKKVLNLSMAFPVVNGLYKKEFNRIYIDGGATDNIPVFPFLAHNEDIIIILHCYASYLPPKMLLEKNHFVIDIDVTTRCRESVSSFALSKKNLTEMYRDGYEYGKEFSRYVFCDNRLEGIKQRGQYFIRQEAEKRNKKKPTFFSLVSFLNKIQLSRGFKIDNN